MASTTSSSFLTVDNLKTCEVVFSQYMRDRHRMLEQDMDKNRKILYDVMRAIAKDSSKSAWTLRELNNLTIHMARQKLPVAATATVVPLNNLERDALSLGLSTGTPTHLPPPAMSSSVDASFQALLEARKVGPVLQQQDLVEKQPPIRDEPIKGDEFSTMLGHLERIRQDGVFAPDAYVSQAARPSGDADPGAVHRASMQAVDAFNEDLEQADRASYRNFKEEALIDASQTPSTCIDKYLSINGFDRNWTTDRYRYSYTVTIAGFDENTMQSVYRNVQSMAVCKVVLPMEIIQEPTVAAPVLKQTFRHDFRFAFPYIMVSIDGFDDVYDGTNDRVRRAFCKLIYQRHYKAPNGRGYIVLEPMQCEVKRFHPAPLSSLKNLRLSLRRPNGTLLNDSVDDYSVVKIEYEELNSLYLKIVTDKYFDKNEFYPGDSVLIKGFKINEAPTSSDKERFDSFVNRPEGHDIVQHGQANDNGFYRTFYIYGPGVLDQGQGRVVLDSAALAALSAYNCARDWSDLSAAPKNGAVINASLQNIIAMKVGVAVSDASVVKTSLI